MLARVRCVFDPAKDRLNRAKHGVSRALAEMLFAGPHMSVKDGRFDYGEVREITTEHPETRLVLLGHGISSVESAQLLAFGASACLSVSTQVRDLRHAVHLASRGLQLQLLPTNRDIQDTEPLLTPREGDVLSLLRENRSNAQIALGLGIGVETVRSHEI